MQEMSLHAEDLLFYYFPRWVLFECLASARFLRLLQSSLNSLHNYSPYLYLQSASTVVYVTLDTYWLLIYFHWEYCGATGDSQLTINIPLRRTIPSGLSTT